MSANKHPLVFYDGFCGLCDRIVQFIIKHDKRKRFRFASLQSDLFIRLLGGRSISSDSFILYDNGKIFDQSTAVLKMLKKLGGIWSLLYVFIFVPVFARDSVYHWVAKNRYKWFGKFDSCRIPSPGQKELFIS